MSSTLQAPPKLPERPLSVVDAAAWLGYDPATVRRLIKHKNPAKRLEATMVGGQWRIMPAALLRLLEKEYVP